MCASPGGPDGADRRRSGRPTALGRCQPQPPPLPSSWRANQVRALRASRDDPIVPATPLDTEANDALDRLEKFVAQSIARVPLAFRRRRRRTWWFCRLFPLLLRLYRVVFVVVTVFAKQIGPGQSIGVGCAVMILRTSMMALLDGGRWW